MKAAVLFWNGEETEVLKELVGELAAWYSGVGMPGAVEDETTEGDEGEEGLEDGGDEGEEDGDEVGEAPPAPHRRVTEEDAEQWWRWKQEGMTLKEIAVKAERPFGTVARWVAEYGRKKGGEA